MATGTNGIATVADCVSKGCTQSDFSDTTQCPTYGDFTGCPTYTTTAVTVSSKVQHTTATNSICKVTQIQATLSAALPFTIYLEYSALNSSNAIVKAYGSISAGSTSTFITNPYGSTTQMQSYSLTAAPKISLSNTETATSTSTSKKYFYKISKSLTTK